MSVGAVRRRPSSAVPQEPKRPHDAKWDLKRLGIQPEWVTSSHGVLRHAKRPHVPGFRPSWLNSLDPYRMYKPDPSMSKRLVLQNAAFYNKFPAQILQQPDVSPNTVIRAMPPRPPRMRERQDPAMALKNNILTGFSLIPNMVRSWVADNIRTVNHEHFPPIKSTALRMHPNEVLRSREKRTKLARPQAMEPSKAILHKTILQATKHHQAEERRRARLHQRARTPGVSAGAAAAITEARGSILEDSSPGSPLSYCVSPAADGKPTTNTRNLRKAGADPESTGDASSAVPDGANNKQLPAMGRSRRRDKRSLVEKKNKIYEDKAETIAAQRQREILNVIRKVIRRVGSLKEENEGAAPGRDDDRPSAVSDATSRDMAEHCLRDVGDDEDRRGQSGFDHGERRRRRHRHHHSDEYYDRSHRHQHSNGGHHHSHRHKSFKEKCYGHDDTDDRRERKSRHSRQFENYGESDFEEDEEQMYPNRRHQNRVHFIGGGAEDPAIPLPMAPEQPSEDARVEHHPEKQQPQQASDRVPQQLAQVNDQEPQQDDPADENIKGFSSNKEHRSDSTHHRKHGRKSGDYRAGRQKHHRYHYNTTLKIPMRRSRNIAVISPSDSSVVSTSTTQQSSDAMRALPEPDPDDVKDYRNKAKFIRRNLWKTKKSVTRQARELTYPDNRSPPLSYVVGVRNSRRQLDYDPSRAYAIIGASGSKPRHRHRSHQQQHHHQPKTSGHHHRHQHRR
ncbi:unnamed protein product, partial [Notodromas monacha]